MRAPTPEEVAWATAEEAAVKMMAGHMATVLAIQLGIGPDHPQYGPMCQRITQRLGSFYLIDRRAPVFTTN